MNKKLIVGLVALLLIGAVIGGLFWYRRKKSTPTAENPGGVGSTLTDKDGNQIVLSGEEHPQYGFALYVNGNQNGHLDTLYLRADGLIEGVSRSGAKYVFRSGAWELTA
jgi:hypothetical protein